MDYRFDRHSVGIHAEISWTELHQCLWSICSHVYRGNIPKQSVFQYLEKRFDRSVRMCASFAFSFFMVNDSMSRANLLQIRVFGLLLAHLHGHRSLCASVSIESKWGSSYWENETEEYVSFEIIVATGLNIWLSVVSIGVICTFYSSVVSSIDQKEQKEHRQYRKYDEGICSD